MNILLLCTNARFILVNGSISKTKLNVVNRARTLSQLLLILHSIIRYQAFTFKHRWNMVSWQSSTQNRRELNKKYEEERQFSEVMKHTHKVVSYGWRNNGEVWCGSTKTRQPSQQSFIITFYFDLAWKPFYFSIIQIPNRVANFTTSTSSKSRVNQTGR